MRNKINAMISRYHHQFFEEPNTLESPFDEDEVPVPDEVPPPVEDDELPPFSFEPDGVGEVDSLGDGEVEPNGDPDPDGAGDGDGELELSGDGDGEEAGVGCGLGFGVGPGLGVGVGVRSTAMIAGGLVAFNKRPPANCVASTRARYWPEFS